MQNQLVCAGCRNLLLFPRGAARVCCAICSTISPVPVTGMAQLTCMGCCTLLMYTPGATNVRCSCCNTINLAREAHQPAYINCGRCRTTLMYPHGASSVKCSVCQHITAANVVPAPPPPPYSPNEPSTSGLSNNGSQPQRQYQTVVVENPMSVDEHGKLVSNVVVGVTTGKD